MGWHWLIQLYGCQVDGATIHPLYMVSCAHRPKSSPLRTRVWPPFYLPRPLPPGQPHLWCPPAPRSAPPCGVRAFLFVRRLCRCVALSSTPHIRVKSSGLDPPDISRRRTLSGSIRVATNGSVSSSWRRAALHHGDAPGPLCPVPRGRTRTCLCISATANNAATNAGVRASSQIFFFHFGGSYPGEGWLGRTVTLL